MLYALSVLYKSKVPLAVVFNKTDVADCGFAKSWMTDYDTFDEALSKEDNYLASLSRSMGLVLDEFYQKIPHAGVSALTGQGYETLFDQFDLLKRDYFEVFAPDLKKE